MSLTVRCSTGVARLIFVRSVENNFYHKYTPVDLKEFDTFIF